MYIEVHYYVQRISFIFFITTLRIFSLVRVRREIHEGQGTRKKAIIGYSKKIFYTYMVIENRVVETSNLRIIQITPNMDRSTTQGLHQERMDVTLDECLIRHGSTGSVIK